MRARWSWSWLVLAGALACGGRYQRVGSEDGEGGSEQARAGAASGSDGASRAGTSSGGQAASGAGTGPSGSGATDGGGATSRGGVAAGGACNCDPRACLPGYLSVPNADGCCFHCEVDRTSCEQQRQGYVAFRQMLLAKYSQATCSANAQCAVYFDDTPCGPPLCGFPIDASAWNYLDDNLNAYAEAYCNPECPPSLRAPCDGMPTPQCLHGTCQ